MNEKTRNLIATFGCTASVIAGVMTSSKDKEVELRHVIPTAISVVGAVAGLATIVKNKRDEQTHRLG